MERRCFDYYFRSSRMPEWTPKEDLKKVAAGWWSTEDEAVLTAEGMAMAACHVAGYKSGKILIYEGEAFIRSVGF